MRNLAFGDQQILRVVILRKLFGKLLTTGSMFLLDLFWGMEGGWGLLKLHVLFMGDFCWKIQMRKNGVTMKKRNSF